MFFLSSQEALPEKARSLSQEAFPEKTRSLSRADNKGAFHKETIEKTP